MGKSEPVDETEQVDNATEDKAEKKAKVKKTMGEFKKGALHSGSKTGPKVTNLKQAVAIALSQSGQGNDDQSFK